MKIYVGLSFFENSYRRTSISIDCATSFSIEIIAEPFILSWFIFDHMKFLIIFNFEKVLSPLATEPSFTVSATTKFKELQTHRIYKALV